ncbi:hypothetical protein CBER1_07082 [Cercospora berteroae]|uniref:Uncharacterized protein n=1 Tax=Cercospora berteroae TaxID=357750 RepID=A0A2S6BTS9_9PEZI|nr:hypothetical protein CBER1_07082 [Cercospora berteroae]
MYQTQEQLIARFSRLKHLSPAQLAQFSRDVDTLRPRNYHDNREIRRSAICNLVGRLGLCIEDAAAVVNDLMMLFDARHGRGVMHRDPHPRARTYRRSRRNQLPTPDPEVVEEEETIGDYQQELGPPQGPLTPDPTPSRQSQEPGARFDVSWPQPPTPAPWLNTPVHQETIQSLSLENSMLRATLTERDYEIFELELSNGRLQVEAMSERAKQRRVKQRFRDLANEED